MDGRFGNWSSDVFHKRVKEFFVGGFGTQHFLECFRDLTFLSTRLYIKLSISINSVVADSVESSVALRERNDSRLVLLNCFWT